MAVEKIREAFHAVKRRSRSGACETCPKKQTAIDAVYT
jgi:hypothetical protein